MEWGGGGGGDEFRKKSLIFCKENEAENLLGKADSTLYLSNYRTYFGLILPGSHQAVPNVRRTVCTVTFHV